VKVCMQIQAAIAQRAGVGRYIHTLLPELAQRAGADELLGFYFDFRRNGSPFPEGMIQEHACRWLPGALIQQSWKRVGMPPYTAFAPKADVHHFPNFIIPPLPRGPKAVVNIHDVCFLSCPETMEPKNRAYLQSQMPKTLGRADCILTISESMATELRDSFSLSEDRVRATLLGAPPSIPDLSDPEVEQELSGLQIDAPFYLHVGTLEPRKNHRFLFQVFEQLDRFDGKLILCGMHGWQVEGILDAWKHSSAAERIRHLDYVSDRQLAALYRKAQALLFPSLYEGFGLPPVEAMRQGCPVFSSPGGSLAEVVGEGGEVLPLQVDAWVDRLGDFPEDAARRERMQTAGRKRAQAFSWERCADETWDVYRELA